MAFSIRSLSVLAYANGFTLWHYNAGQDRVDRVLEIGFFDEGADMLALGDIMMASGVDGARMLCVGLDARKNPTLVPVGCRSSSGDLDGVALAPRLGDLVPIIPTEPR